MYKFLTIIGLLMVPAIASAAPIIYECNYNGRGEKGWISDRAYYLIDEEMAFGSVYDGVVMIANDDKPLSIPIEVRKGKVYVLKYNLRLPARGNREIKVIYRVRLDAAKLKTSIRVWAGESDLADVGGGTCKVAKRK